VFRRRVSIELDLLKLYVGSSGAALRPRLDSTLDSNCIFGGCLREVFTLWPLEGGAAPQRGVNEDGIPLWALATPEPAAPARWGAREALSVVLIAAMIIALATTGPGETAGFLVAATASLATVGALLFMLTRHRRTVARYEQELDECRRWNDTIFERTGVALWREDWTAARDAVLALLRSGVHDMEAHFAANPDALRAIRSKVFIKDVNRFAIQRTSAKDKSELLGSLDKLLPDTDHTFVQWLVAFARGDSFYRSETHITKPDGTAVDTLFTAGLPQDMRGFENILVNDLDITEYKAAQARVAQAELEVARAARVTTVGALSASIAHEVNSPLVAIVSNAEASLRWLQRDQPDLDEAVAALREAIAAAARAQAVVERTRAFLSNAPSSVQLMDVRTLVQDSALLIDRELRSYGVSLLVDAGVDLPLVSVDPVQLQQVLVNLMMNAGQAMNAQGDRRDLAIRIHHGDGRVQIDVTDTGPGIPANELSTIFEPFYSTKPNGMGMGLAICRNCVEANEGRLWVTSTVGKGTTFHVDIPAAGDGYG